MKSLYRKTNVDICSAKSMHDFLRNHFNYYTMNSWNGLKSIANNVKIYNLNLEGDQWKALERLEITDYSVVNDLIDSWENDHPEVKIGFNGRSGGYIVLYRDKGFSDVLPECIADYDYEDFKLEMSYGNFDENGLRKMTYGELKTAINNGEIERNDVNE